MNSSISRRDLLRFAGGGVLGLLLSPLPWKVLDDSAIWTQNWPWIPEPSRGPITWSASTCSLCGAGCGVRVRSSNGHPVSLAGQAGHPMSAGTLCATGLLAHHLACHPSRVLQPIRITNGTERTAADMATIVAAIHAAHSASTSASPAIAVIDSRPGRAASRLLMELAHQWPSAAYGVAPQAGRARTDLIRKHFRTAVPEFAADIQHARLIVSFGAPLVDGWGTAATARTLLAETSAHPRPRLIQIEPVRSRTANVAETWIPVTPGTEHVCALAIAQAIIEGRRMKSAVRARAEDAAALAAFLHDLDLPPAVRRCGISDARILEIARSLSDEPASVVVASPAAPEEVQSAVLLLNLVAGTFFREGGLRPLPEIPGAARTTDARTLEDFDDHSLSVIILDESAAGADIPAAVFGQKLKPGSGIVVSLSPFAAPRPVPIQYVIPAAVWGERLTDVAGTSPAGEISVGLAMPVMPARPDTFDTAAFLGAVTGTSQPSTEEILRQRIAAIWSGRRGMVYDPSSPTLRPVHAFGGTDALWSVLQSGGCWIDGPRPAGSMPAFRFLPAGLAEHLTKRVAATKAATAPALALVITSDPLRRDQAFDATLMSKVRDESGLYLPCGSVAIHPTTAEAHNVGVGDDATLSINGTTLPVHIACDSSVPPGLVSAMDGDGPVALAQSKISDRSVGSVASATSAPSVIPVTLWKA